MNRPPLLKPAFNSLDLALEAIALLSLLISTVYLWVSVDELPDLVATHFNAQGEPNDWASPNSFWFFIAIGAAVYVLLTFLAKTPKTFNYPVKITEYNAQVQYTLAIRLLRWAKALITLTFTLLLFVMIDSAKTGSSGFPVWLLPLVLAVILAPVFAYYYLARKHR